LSPSWERHRDTVVLGRMEAVVVMANSLSSSSSSSKATMPRGQPEIEGRLRKKGVEESQRRKRLDSYCILLCLTGHSILAMFTHDANADTR